MDTEKKNFTDKDTLERNLRIMEVVEKELNTQKKDAMFCLFSFICALNIWILIVALWYMLDMPVSVEVMTFGIEIIAAIMLLLVLKFTRIGIRDMGISKDNLKPSLKRAAVISASIAAIMIIAKLIVHPEQPLFDMALFDHTYIFTSVFQEFLARGFLLTTLVNINSSKNSKHTAVFCSSLFFSSLHLFYGFPYMISACLLSIFLGYCYLKDRNIWGVSLIHYVLGTLIFIMDTM